MAVAMKDGTRIVAGVIVSLLFLAGPAHADVVWPALYLEARLFSWWAIIAGLAAEYVFVRLFFADGARQALAADLVMNLVSTLCGVVLIPLAGIAWEVFPGLVLYRLFNVGTFNPGTWTATFILAVLINAALESLVLKRVFKMSVGAGVSGGCARPMPAAWPWPPSRSISSP